MDRFRIYGNILYYLLFTGIINNLAVNPTSLSLVSNTLSLRILKAPGPGVGPIINIKEVENALKYFQIITPRLGLLIKPSLGKNTITLLIIPNFIPKASNAL